MPTYKPSDCSPIGFKETKPYQDINFYDLKEYDKIARKMIQSIASKFYRGLVKEALDDPDVVSDVTYTIILADWHFNGHGSLYGFRKQRVIWYFQEKYKRQQRTNKKIPHGIGLQLFGLDPQGKPRDEPAYYDNYVETEYANTKTKKLLNSEVLNSKEREIVKMRYIDELTYKDIAGQFGVSRQCVEQCCKKAIRKLKAAF